MLVFGPKRADNKAREFPEDAHKEGPAELPFFVESGLDDMAREREAEEDRESDGGGERRVIVVVSITGPFWNIAILIRGHADA